MGGEPRVIRGQAEVLGTVLLLGIVVTIAVLIGGFALGSFSPLEEQSADEAIEQALLDVRSAATDAALTAEASQAISMDLPDNAHVTMADTETTFRIEHVNHTGDGSVQTIYERSDLGAIEVTRGDTTYALEGGGLFKRTETGGHLVAPPTLALRGYTANLPMIVLETDDGEIGETIELVSGDPVSSAFPTEGTYDDTDQPLENPVYNGTILLSVTGPNYEGWYDFFEQFVDGEVTIDHDTTTTAAAIDSIEELSFEAAITYSGSLNEHGASIDSAQQSAFLPDNTELVEHRLEALAEENDNDATDGCAIETGEIGGCTLYTGEYHVDGDLVVTDDIAIDTSEGDVVIGVEGDLVVDGDADIVVTGDGDVEYVIGGMFSFGGSSYVGTDSDAVEADRNLFFVAGDGEDGPGDGNMVLEAIIYAPNAHLDFGGNPTIRGAVFADELTVRGSAELSFDEALIEIEGIDVSDTATPIMYLHVAEHLVTVEA